MVEGCSIREKVIFFSSKILSRLLSRSQEELMCGLCERVKCRVKYEFFDLRLFEGLFLDFGVGVRTFLFEQMFESGFDLLLSMVLLQKPALVELSLGSEGLPKITWALVDQVYPKLRIETIPGSMGEFEKEEFKLFSNPSFPFFGFTVYKI
jgi:hypothetical protein